MNKNSNNFKTAEPESFRDSINIISKEGKRNFVYPKEPKGKFYKLRTWFSILLIAFLIGIPFIKVSGHPLMLFNIIERKFIMFGFGFGPHDFYLFVIAMISFIVFIFLFTAVFGRVFCGWACPQTVFLEIVFRRIEYLIEGDFLSQKRLHSAPWTVSKIFKKLTKWSIFAVISVIIANILISWVTGIDELIKIISEPISQHTAGFIAMISFSVGFYFIFAWFREYACIYICPYGRLQGVLLDQNSIVIAYDDMRGEPRGKLKKGQEHLHGDCVNCNECVVVCPTGIDIRNGTQLECVNCTACIDACDNVMDKISKPRGLIRFASANMIKNKTKFKLTTRIIGYSAVLAVLIAIFTILLAKRQPIDVTILRIPGLTYQEQPGNIISNLYSVKLINKTFDPVSINMELDEIDGEIKIIGNEIILEPDAVSEAKFLILIPKEKLKKMNTPLEIEIYKNNEKFREYKTTFLGPGS
ncbi:MAG TPA: cytochrome c oxidase accessory protein CcoG [Ignavibacteria bacterium]|nr:cytochrome c oxidase accessory protein CcoG [Ignavibacteria bacterium]